MNRELEKLRCSNQPVDGSKLKHVDPVHETVDDLMKPLFLSSCSYLHSHVFLIFVELKELSGGWTLQKTILFFF